ncbi:MAG: hypothetical protein QNJ65_00425 [Xenococcaceae cyanobacterium MO_234.B1]|nr:hypothetical protein [Xenococcaceae cyanobacterium MO_234.B1]
MSFAIAQRLAFGEITLIDFWLAISDLGFAEAAKLIAFGQR